MIHAFEIQGIRRANDMALRRRIYNYKSPQTVMMERDFGTENSHQCYKCIVMDFEKFIIEEISNNSGS